MIGLGRVFYKFAEKNNLNKILWGILGIVGFYVAQIITGIIIAFTNPGMLEENITITIISIVTGLFGSLITWGIMNSVAKNKSKSLNSDSDILDDGFQEIS